MNINLLSFGIVLKLALSLHGFALKTVQICLLVHLLDFHTEPIGKSLLTAVDWNVKTKKHYKFKLRLWKMVSSNVNVLIQTKALC